MKRIETRLWKNGCTRAVSFTFDDGRFEDYRLVELFNKYGVKGAFHLCNPGFLESCGYKVEKLVDPADYKKLYEGQEISCHLMHHPFPKWQPTEAILREAMDNRRFLEDLCGYPVRGMSYPFANYDQRVIDILHAAGLVYSRTANDTNAFGLPEDFMRWDPTCNWSQAEGLVDKFFSPMRYDFMRLFYIWGHSYELSSEEKWADMERLLQKLSGRDDVWYATNIEIYDYMQAVRALRFSAECDTVYNPSAIPVWFEADREVFKAEPGKVTKIS
ncbi:MAG: polysaccharide deacetylase family protein [Clostridia bacterium]|nr:polysaccharide deacetylase family protein [Clostridia bacterium]